MVCRRSLHAGTFWTTSDAVVTVQWEKCIQFHSFPLLHPRYFKTAYYFADKMLATSPSQAMEQTRDTIVYGEIPVHFEHITFEKKLD